MDGYEVVPQDVEAVAGQMATHNHQIDADMNRLLDQLSALRGLWSGPAATSFHDAKERWAARATDHNRRLADIAAGLTKTHGHYTRTEEANTGVSNRYRAASKP